MPPTEYTNNQSARVVLMLHNTTMKLTKVSNADTISTVTLRLVPVKLAVSCEIR